MSIRGGGCSPRQIPSRRPRSSCARPAPVVHRRSVPGVWSRFSTSWTPWICASARRARRSGRATGARRAAARSLLRVDVDRALDLVLVAEELRLDLAFSVASSYGFGRRSRRAASLPSTTAAPASATSHAATPRSHDQASSSHHSLWLSRFPYRVSGGRKREEPELEHARRVEAVDPKQRAGGRRRGACRHQPHELRADHLRAARRASRSIRATISWSAAASQSSTFMLTWTSPARGRSSPSARTPGKPPPVSRTSAAIASRGLELAAQVDVERDQRPTGADEHPARAPDRAARGPKSGAARPRRSAAELVRAAAPEERRAAAWRQLAVEEDGQAELRPDRRASASAVSARARHPLGPDRHERDDVRGADARMRAPVRAQVDPLARHAIAASSASTSSPRRRPRA